MKKYIFPTEVTGSEKKQQSYFTKTLRETREKRASEYKDSKYNPYSQKSIAEKIGVSRTTYSNYETGDKLPKIETFYKLCEVLGVSCDYLLGYSKSPIRENRDVANSTGLSDENIEKFKTYKDKKITLFLINNILNNSKLINLLREYLVEKPMKDIFNENEELNIFLNNYNSNFDSHPIKTYMEENKYEYYKLIEYMPLLQEEFKNKLIDITNKKDYSLFFEFFSYYEKIKNRDNEIYNKLEDNEIKVHSEEEIKEMNEKMDKMVREHEAIELEKYLETDEYNMFKKINESYQEYLKSNSKE
ncbi:MAG: helix-turn-helix transcriptional regulator [Clostridia bacterium]|nr:helix-turn-helix transcriptional regulator [Clostridia bacterium]